MTLSFRLLFAVLVALCGVYILTNAHDAHILIATGLGLLLAGVGLVVP